jgi:DNA gyrase subunit A
MSKQPDESKVDERAEIMLVTDGGQLIRCPVDGIRVAGRATQGVIVLDTDEGERVVSVERVGEVGEGDDDAAAEAEDEAGE